MEKNMFENKNELEAREEILGIVDEYCKKYHNQKKYKEGDRIPYASRVYDTRLSNYFGDTEGTRLVGGSFAHYSRCGTVVRRFL